MVSASPSACGDQGVSIGRGRDRRASGSVKGLRKLRRAKVASHLPPDGAGSNARNDGGIRVYRRQPGLKA